jgi:acyl-CoA thioesterase I
MIMSRVIAILFLVSLPGCERPAARDAAPAADTVPRAAPVDSADARAADPRDVVLFIGTSLTAGYGLGEEFAYPALLQERIDSAGLPFRVVNAGISGETSAGGVRRIDWMLQQPLAVLVLELGANDGLRGQPPAALRANLDTIISRTRARYADTDIVLVGVEAPPNLGPEYTTAFRAVFSDLARERNLALVPFLLEDVAGVPALNLEDGMHPNERGHRIMAATVWDALAPVLERRAR